MRRKPALAALAAVSILALVSLLAGGAWFTIHLSQALDVAQRERYASDMNLGHLSWRDQSIPRVLELLDRYRAAMQKKYRSFEWSYLASALRPAPAHHPERDRGATISHRLQPRRPSPRGVARWTEPCGSGTRTRRDNPHSSRPRGRVGQVVFSPQGGLLATSVRTGPSGSGIVATGKGRFRPSLGLDGGISPQSRWPELAISDPEWCCDPEHSQRRASFGRFPFSKRMPGTALILSPDGRLARHVRSGWRTTSSSGTSPQARAAADVPSCGTSCLASARTAVSWPLAKADSSVSGSRRREISSVGWSPRSQRSAGGAFLQAADTAKRVRNFVAPSVMAVPTWCSAATAVAWPPRTGITS